MTKDQKKIIMDNISKSGYFFETAVDLICSFAVYHLFGFEIAVVAILALIMIDIATIMKKQYESTPNTEREGE